MSDEAKHLGRTVEVWWDSDEAWYRGRIDNFHPSQGWHVQYDDGEREWIAEAQFGDFVRFVDDHDNDHDHDHDDAFPDDDYDDRDRDGGGDYDSSELNVVSGTQVYRNAIASPSATQQQPHSYDAQVGPPGWTFVFISGPLNFLAALVTPRLARLEMRRACGGSLTSRHTNPIRTTPRLARL